MNNILVFIIKALTIYVGVYGIVDRICNCIEKCKKGDDYLNTESFVDILDEIGKMNKHYTVDIKK